MDQSGQLELSTVTIEPGALAYKLSDQIISGPKLLLKLIMNLALLLSALAKGSLDLGRYDYTNSHA